jgi:hypothetical protein
MMNRNPSIFKAGFRFKTGIDKDKGPAEMRLTIGGSKDIELAKGSPGGVVFVLGLSPNPQNRSTWFY